MSCDKCEKLKSAVDYTLRALQEQRQINRRWAISGKAAKNVERELEQSYNLARAEQRIHRATSHPERGYACTAEDVHIKIRKGRGRP